MSDARAIAAPVDLDEPLPETPYVGLVPYGEKDAPFFFGREDEKRIVTANLRAARLTVLYGPSGVGKSSLLLAGVVHDLRASVARTAGAHPERAPFGVCVFRSWTEEPLRPLVDAIREAAVEALGGDELPPWRHDEPLLETLRAWTQRVRTILVVLDQFEDYFLYSEEAGEGGFDAEFANVVNEPNLRVNFLISIREDAWAKLDRFEGRIPQVFGNYVRVEHLGREAARQAIMGPVGVWNERLPPGAAPYSLEPELVEAVVEAAASGRLTLAESVSAAPVEPTASTDAVEAPFLQLVMDRLWRATVEASSHALTTERLQELGGAQQIVESHLVDVMGALEPNEREIAAELFRFLVTRSKTKIAHSASDLAEWTNHPESEVVPVLRKLCRGESGRILRELTPLAGDPEGARYELFHDVLAEPMLEWRKRYEQKRESEEVAARLEAEQAARLEAERQRQRERRNRLFRISAVSLLVLATVLAVLSAVAVTQWRDAVGLAHEAHSRQLAGLSLGDAEPIRALQRAALGVDEKPTPEATAALETALATTPVEALLHGHEGRILGAAFSPDNKLVATAGADGTTRVWDPATGKGLVVLKGHNGPVRSVTFAADGKRVLTAAADGTARIWSVPEGRELAVFSPSKRYERASDVFVPFVSAAFSPDGTRVLMSSPDGAARVWNVTTRDEALVVRPPIEGGVLNSAAFSPDGGRIAVASDDGTAQVWDVASQQKLATMEGHQGEVNTAGFSPDGTRLVTLGQDGTVRIWRVATEKRTVKINFARFGFESPAYAQIGVAAAAFSPNGALVSIVGNGRAAIWDPGTRRRRLLSTRDTVGATFSADSTRLATADRDGTVRIWDTRSGRVERVFRVHDARAYATAFSSDDDRLVTASGDGTAIVWSVRRAQTLTRARGFAAEHSGAVLSSDGTAVLTLSDGPARLLALTPGKTPTVLKGEPGTVYDAAFSPDGRLVGTAHADGIARIWNIRGRLVATLAHGGRGPVFGIAFSPDGKLVVTTGEDGAVRIWDVATRTVRAVLGPAREPIFRATFSPDGTQVLTAGLGPGGTRVWDVRSRRPVREFRTYDVYAAAFSPDGDRVVIASRSAGTSIWSLGNGRISVSRPFARPHYGAAFSPDGRRVVTTGSDGTSVWQIATGKLVVKLRGHEGFVWSGAFSPNGRLVATAGSDGNVRIWDVSRGVLVSVVPPISCCDAYRAQFSPDGALVVIAGHDGVRVWSEETKKPIGLFRGPIGPVTNGNVGPSGNVVVTFSEGTARLWNLETGRSHVLPNGRREVTAIALSRDGNGAVTGSEDGTVRVWRASTPGLVAVLGRPASSDRFDFEPHVEAVALSNDGRHAAAGSIDGTARVWEVSTGKSTPQVDKPLRGHSGSVNDVAFSPNGEFVVTASEDKTAVIWTTNGTRGRVLRGHTSSVEHATFDPEGKLVLTTTRDGTARVWDVETGAACAVLGRYPARIVSAQFADSAGTVVTVRADGSVRAERAETCALAITGKLRDVARRIVRVLSADLRRELSTSSEG